MTSSNTQFQLITISREAASGLKKMETFRRLTDEEHARYVRNVKVLLELRGFNQSLESAGRAWTDFAQEWANAERAADRLQANRESQEEAKAVLNLRLSAFLTSTKAFLDHTTTRLTRTYGGESAQFAAFEEATRREFDRSAAYRICSKLRHFIQHCGSAITFVGVHGWIENPPHGPRRQRVRISCTSEDLIARYNKWTHVSDDLRAFGDDLPLVVLTEAYLRDLAQVHNSVLETEVARYADAGQQIVRLLNEVDDPNKTAAVAEVGRYENGEQTIALVEAPFFNLWRWWKTSPPNAAPVRCHQEVEPK